MALALLAVGGTCAGLYTHEWQHERVVHVDGRVVQQHEAPDPSVGLSTVCWSRIEVPAPAQGGTNPSGPTIYLIDSTSPPPCNPQRLGTYVPTCHSRGRGMRLCRGCLGPRARRGRESLAAWSSVGQPSR